MAFSIHNWRSIRGSVHKLKTKLRQAKARTRQALKEALHLAIDWITSLDAKAWFNRCGYHVYRS
jgi:hypothetical protein